jgi:hypothetical protein
MASRCAGRSAIGAVMAAVTFGMSTGNAAAAAAAQPSKPPVFSKSEQLEVVREVCGAAKAASAVGDISTPETVHGFITADEAMFYVELLSEGYEVQKTVGHAIVFGGHQLTDENKISSHEAARTTVCATLLEFLPAQPIVLRFVDGAYTPVGRTAAVQALWKILQSPWQ